MMTTGYLVRREISHRRASFALGLAAVAAAVACLAAAVTLSEGHDRRTEALLVEKEAETRAEMARLEDDYRMIMRRLGYNVLVLHRDQDFGELQARGYPTAYMPEDYAEQLGRGGIETLNHLLPVLQEKITWRERGREIFLTGIRGQVPVYHKTQFLTPEGEYRSPIMEAVPPGAADIGFELGREHGLGPGDRIRLSGRDFTIRRVFPRRGNQDDITAWIDLETAQAILGRPGLVNGILALECVCDFEQLGAIEEEITAILPDVRVLEFGSLVSVRGRARQRAAEEHRRAVDSEMEYRARLRAEMARTFRVLIPVIVAGAAVAVFVLMMNNVRERQPEIGVLRALGWEERKIMALFLARAFLIGLAGVLPGLAAGFAAGAAWSGWAPLSRDALEIFRPGLLLALVPAAPLLSCLAGWLPARSAAGRDPAGILRDQQ